VVIAVERGTLFGARRGVDAILYKPFVVDHQLGVVAKYLRLVDELHERLYLHLSELDGRHIYERHHDGFNNDDDQFVDIEF
jgi:hypothetical protein